MKFKKEWKDEIIDILKDNIKGLKAVYIFGSYSDNSANENSDLDIAFLSFEKIDKVEVWSVSNKIANSLNIDVDLVNLKDANQVLQFQIITNGKRVYEEDFEIEKYETTIYSLYLKYKEDVKPIIDKIVKSETILGV